MHSRSFPTLLAAAVASAMCLQGRAHAAPPYRVKDIAFGDTSSIGTAPWSAAVGNVLLFSANGGTNGEELWRSDGTSAGTYRLAGAPNDAVLGSPGGIGVAFGRAPILGGFALFRARPPSGSNSFWKTDGSAQGTSLVSDTTQGFAYGVPFGNGVLFAGGQDAKGALYKTDGTTSGTTVVKSFLAIRGIMDLGNGTAVLAASSISPPSNGIQLFGTNGTGTTLLNSTALNVDLSYGTSAVLNGVALFVSTTSSSGTATGGLWRTDGTAGGTNVIANLIVEGNTDKRETLVKVGSVIFFAGWGATGRGLWKSDTTEAGTVILKNVTSGVSQLVAVGNTLYFVCRPLSDYELWKSDGTQAGTVRVKGGFDSIEDLTVYRDTLYFSADDNVSGEELWSSDGTEQGTKLVFDIAPDSASSSPSMIRGAGNSLFFAAQDDESGRELWALDVTPPAQPGVDAGISDSGASDASAADAGFAVDAAASADDGAVSPAEMDASGETDAAVAGGDGGEQGSDAQVTQETLDGGLSSDGESAGGEHDTDALAKPRSSGGCHVAASQSSSMWAVALALLSSAVVRRRRRV